MDPLLFGDNQFFGINHMSEEKARMQAMRFQNVDAIMEVLDAAYDAGVRTFMCTTHDRVSEICDVMRANPKRYEDFIFYPCMPYAHKYANAVTDHGMVGALTHFMPEDGLMRTVMKSGKALATKDIEGIVQVLIDAEMKMFKGMNTPVIFMQNVFTDLLLGLGFNKSFKMFHDHIIKTYNAEPGFITMNTPMLYAALEEQGIRNPIVCSNINKIGFRMSGGLDAYLHTLKTKEIRAIAMSVLASGAIPPAEAIEWLSEQPNIQSLLFGASSKRNIESTRDLANKYMGCDVRPRILEAEK